MNELTLWTDPMIHRIGFAIVHSLWIFVGVGALLAVLLRIIPSKNAAIRHHLSLASLISMLLISLTLFAWAPGLSDNNRIVDRPSNTEFSAAEDLMLAKSNQTATSNDETEAIPAFALNPSQLENSDSDPQAAQSNLGPSGPLTKDNLGKQISDRAQPLLAIAWFFGLGLFSIRRMLSIGDLMKFRRTCRVTTDAKLLSLVAQVKKRLHLQRHVDVVESEKTITPVVFGWIRPTLAVPLGFLSGLPIAQADAIIAHELAHIKRYDYLLHLFQLLVETLLFYHPVTWWISRQIRTEREHCCDDVAINSGCQSIELAQAIVDFEQRRKDWALAFTDSNTSAERVKRLLAAKSIQKHSFLSTALFAIGNLIFCGVIISLCLNSPAVAHGQQDEVEPSVDRVLYIGYQASWTGRFLHHSVETTGDDFVSVPLNADISKRKHSRRCKNIIQQLPHARALIIHEWALREESQRLQEAIVERVNSGKMNLVVLPSADTPFGVSKSHLIPELANLLPFKKYCDPELQEESTTGKVEFSDFDDSTEMDLYQLTGHIELRNQTTVLGTFTVGSKSQPLIVSRNLGEGTVSFVATSELWRMRAHSPKLHQHIWNSLLGLNLPQLSEEMKRQLLNQINTLRATLTISTVNIEQAKTKVAELKAKLDLTQKARDAEQIKTLMIEVAEVESNLVGIYSEIEETRVRLNERLEFAQIMEVDVDASDNARDSGQQKAVKINKDAEAEYRKKAEKLINDLADARRQVVQKEHAILSLRENSNVKISQLEAEIAELRKRENNLMERSREKENELVLQIEKLRKDLIHLNDERYRDEVQKKIQEEKSTPKTPTENSDSDVSDALKKFDAHERHKISGIVIDAFGEPVANSVIIPWTSRGSPLAKPNALAVALDDFSQAMQQEVLLTATTDAEGNFELELFPGNYRLVAQTWKNLDQPVKNVLAKNGKLVRLDGVQEFRVSATANENRKVVIEPIGNCNLEIQTNNSSPLLLVSTERLSADPILGFAAWSSNFFTGILCGNQMHQRRTTFSGLPAGEIQLAAFANDNNPGFGGMVVELTDNETNSIDLPIIASWSNGHKTPPQRLQLLVEHMKENPEDEEKIQKIIADARNINSKNPVAVFIKLASLFGRQVELSDGSSHSVEDCLAAVAYLKLK